MRFASLRAAIVRIVCRRAKERTEISSFLSGAQKKSLGRYSRRSGIGSEHGVTGFLKPASLAEVS